MRCGTSSAMDERARRGHRVAVKRAIALSLSCVLLLQSGCGALVFHNPESVIVTCNVPGAIADASGEAAACQAPGTLKLDRTKDHVITVKKPGYATETVRIDSNPSWW